MEVLENSENKEFHITLEDFPFVCRICLRRGDLRLFEEEDYLLDLFVTITNIDVRSTVNFPRNICIECINTLEDISLFIDISKYNNAATQEKNLVPKKENENVGLITRGTSQDYVVKTEKTTEDEEDIHIEGFEICRVCSLTGCPTLFGEKAHLMQLFKSITNIEVEAEINFSKRNNMCNKCIKELEKISLLISSTFYNNMKLKNTIEGNEYLKTKHYLEDNAIDDGKDMKVESISGRDEVMVDNYFKEYSCCNESKDLHTVVDIKEEDHYSPEAYFRKNYRNGLDFCSETTSVEKPLGCDPCENEFSTESTEDHLKIISKGLEVNLESQFITKKFKCDCCEKRYNRKNNLKSHMIIHSGEKPFKCDFCENSFVYKSVLKSHMVNHTGEKPFKCDDCEKSYATKRLLKYHLFTLTREKPFKCEYCEKSFSFKAILKRHILTHTGEKPFKCNFCEYRSSHKSSLKKHTLIHSGEKPFKCDYCKKSFATRTTLKYHLRTHTGETPFKCDHCKKSFTQKGCLKRHLLTHSKEKPFKCDHCEKSFTIRRYLKKHLLTHTRKTSQM